MWKSILTFLLFVLLIKSGQAIDTLIITDQTPKYDVTKYIQFFTDSSATINIDQIIGDEIKPQYNNVTKTPINLGTRNYPHWFEIKIINQSSREDWIIEIEYPTLNDVVFYVLDSKKNLVRTVNAGLDYSTPENKTNTYSIFYTQSFAKNETYTILIRIKTESFIILPINILNDQAFIQKDRNTLTYLYLLYGIMLALLGFNFILFILTREVNYFLLFIYLSLMIINAHYLYGYGFDIFPSMGPILRSKMRLLLFASSSLVFMLFSINYLNLRKYKFIFRIYLILIVMSLIYIPSIFINHKIYSLFSKISPFLYFFGAITIFGSGIYTYIKKERLAIYYVVSFSVFTVSSLIYILTLFDLIPFKPYTFNINSIAAVLFGMLLTIGLVEKITAIRQEKAKAHQLEQMNLILTKEIEERTKIEKALRESEYKFRQLFQLSPQPISLTEMETGLVLDINHQMEKIIGLTKQEILGKTSLEIDVITETDRKRILAGLQETNQLMGLEIKLKPIIGQPINCLIYCVCENINGRNTLISVFSDITEQKRQQEILRLSEKQLRELNATKDKFFSIIAHDLMNPFNAMLGFSHLLIDSIKNEQKEQSLSYASVIDQSTVRIYNLLQNLLIWSKSQSGKISFSPSKVNVIELLMNSTDILRNMAKNKNVDFNFEIQQNEILFVDQNMLGVVIRNLVSNAIKFSNEGSKVIISFSKSEKDYQFRVTDFGIGIERELLTDLFTIEKTTSTSPVKDERFGFGLGLLLCSDFVLAHNGQIWAESEPGKGLLSILISQFLLNLKFEI